MKQLVVPKSYCLGGVKCTVELVPKIEHDSMLVAADWDSEMNLIRLATHLSNGKEKPGDKIGHDFCHELVHSMWDALGWEKLNDDEGKVDAMGRMLHQYLTTASGCLIKCES